MTIGEERTGAARMATTKPWLGRAEDLARPFLPWAFVAWLLGVLGMSVWHLGGWVQLWRIRAQGSEPADPAIRDVFGRLVERLRISRPVRLLQSARVAVPVVVGWLRPVVLLPAATLSGLTPWQLEAVLAHELLHVRRYDCLVRLMQALVETLLFYHPAVWWVSGRIRQQSEHCCDELAVEVCGDRQSYARALARVAELGRRKPHLAAAASGGSLLNRIRRILGLEVQVRLTSPRSLAGVLCIAGILALALPLLPRAQSKANGHGDGPESSAVMQGSSPYDHFLFTRHDIDETKHGTETLVMARITPETFELRDVYTRREPTWRWEPLCVTEGKAYVIQGDSLLGIDMATGEAQKLCWPIEGGSYTYDSGMLYALLTGGGGQVTLRAYDMRKGAHRDVTSKLPLRYPGYVAMSVSPDHKRLALLKEYGPRSADDVNPTSHGLIVVDLETGVFTRLACTFRGDQAVLSSRGGSIGSSPHGWLDPETLLFVPDPPFLTARADVVATVKIINVTADEMREVAPLPRVKHRGRGPAVRVEAADRIPMVTMPGGGRYRIDVRAGRLIEDDTVGGDYSLRDVAEGKRVYYREQQLSGTEERMVVAASPDGQQAVWTGGGWAPHELHYYDPADGTVRLVTEIEVSQGWFSGILRWFTEADLSVAPRQAGPAEGSSGAVEGVQVRLRADKDVWQAGEVPTFKADVRNGGERELYDTMGRRIIYELEFDGRWYRDLVRVRKRPLVLEPGQQKDAIGISLGWGWWRREAPNNPELVRGRHTLRVAFSGTFGNPLTADDARPVRAISNPVEIEILPAGEADEPAWGEAVEGVQVRLRADEKVWEAGEVPTLKVEVRNHGKSYLQLYDGPPGFTVEIDGRWHHSVYLSRLGELGSVRIGPGADYEETLPLDDSWRDRDGAVLSLTPGKRYLVRVATSPAGDVNAPNVRAVSNPVEIEIAEGEAGSAQSTERPLVGEVPDQMRKELDRHLSVDFHNTPLRTVVEFLKEVAGVQIVLFERDLPADGAPVTLRYKGSLEEALDLICELAGLSWSVDRNVVKIGGAGRLRSTTSPRVGTVPPDVQKVLDREVRLMFDDTPLRGVVAFLGEVTALRYELAEGDLPADGAPITISFKGTLEQGLDLICEQAGMGWTVEHGAIRIARPKDDASWGEAVEGVQVRLRVDARDPTEPKAADVLIFEVHNGGNVPIAVPTWCGELPKVAIRVRGYPNLSSPTSYGEAWVEPFVIGPGEHHSWRLWGNTFGNYGIAYGRVERGSGWVQFDPAGKTYEIDTVMQWGRDDVAAWEEEKPHSPGALGTAEWWIGRAVSNSVRIALPPRGKPAIHWAPTSPAEKQQEPPWGEAVEGVQVRLRADKTVWKADETPTLKLRARNQGNRELVWMDPGAVPQLEFGGVWYSQVFVVRGRVRAWPLEPGSESHEIAISLGRQWRTQQAPFFLPLKPGKHTIRVAFRAAPAEGDQGKPVRALSNPVEIEIRERVTFLGLDLTDAPRTTNVADLPDLWEERPPGSKSYELRAGVVFARHMELPMVGAVCYVPAKDAFYVQHDSVWSSTLTYYGPFEGKPWERLGIPESATHIIAAPAAPEALSFGPVIEPVVKDGSVGETMLLINERVVFSADDVSWLNENKIAPWLMARLSPDGSHLLYTRVHENQDGQPGARPSHDLWLRDVVTRKDVRVPVPPYPDGWESVCIRFNPFDPRGQRMAVVALGGPREMEAILFDIADDKVSPTGIKGRFAFGRFGRSGKRLIGVQDSEVFVATLPALERTRLILPDGAGRAFPNSVCPTADVFCLYEVRGVPGERRGRQAIALYDFEAREKIADLPTHEENSQLDDLETQWTRDGRYICYYDLADGPQGRIRGTRVWDCVAGKVKTFLEGTAPMGPGAADSHILLVRTRKGDHRPILHDASTGRSWELGDASIRLLHGAGGKVAYIKTGPDDKKTVCVAEIPLLSGTQ